MNRYHFSGGEVSPRIHSRVDLPAYRSSLKSCENWIISPQGGAIKRPGTVLSAQVGTVQEFRENKAAMDESAMVKLIPFRLSPNEQYVLELTHRKIRVHLFDRNRAYPMLSRTKGFVSRAGTAVRGRTYFRAQVDSKKDFTNIYVKLSLSRNLEKKEGELNFSIHEDSYESPALSNMHFKDKGQYLLNASFRNKNELLFVQIASSRAKLGSEVLNLDLVPHGDFVELETPFSGEDVKEVKFYQNGENLYLVHPNYPPQRFSIGKDLSYIAFSSIQFEKMPSIWSAKNASYPGIVSVHEGRTVWSGVRNHPDAIWFSRVHKAYDMDATTSQEDGAIEIYLNLKSGGSILWLSSEEDLYVGTDEGIYSISSQDGFGLRFTSIKSVLKNSSPASTLEPIHLDDALIYLGRDKRKLQRISRSYHEKRILSEDISIFAEHMTEGGMTGLSISRHPENMIWMCRSDGVLVGITYDYTQKILAWHKHKIGGAHIERTPDGVPKLKNYGYVEDALSIFCDGRDVLFLAVRRGSFDKKRSVFREYRTVETLDFSKGESTSKSVAYTDCTLFFKLTTSMNEIGGQREVVLPSSYAYSDLYLNQNGIDKVVSLGQKIYRGKKVAFLPIAQKENEDHLFIGYQYSSYLETLPIIYSGVEPDEKMRSLSVRIHFCNTAYIKIGSSKNSLQVFTFKEPFTGVETVTLDSNWIKDGRIVILSDKPFSGCVFGVFMNTVFSDQGG